MQDNQNNRNQDHQNCGCNSYQSYPCPSCGQYFCYDCAPNNLSEGPGPDRLFVTCPSCGADCSEYY